VPQPELEKVSLLSKALAKIEKSKIKGMIGLCP